MARLSTARRPLPAVTIYPEDDPRSMLPPRVGGYPADVPIPIEGTGQETVLHPMDMTQVTDQWGLDLRNVPSLPEQPSVPARPRVPAELQDPALRELVANLAGMADRVQSGDLVAGAPRPGSVPAQVGQAIMGAASDQQARSPLVPPEVQQFVLQQRGLSPQDIEAIRGDPERLAEVQRRASMLGAFDTLGRNLGTATDLITGVGAPPVDTSSAGRQAQQMVEDEQARQEAVRQFVLRRLGQERAEAEQLRRAEMDERRFREGARQFDEAARARQQEAEARRAFEAEQAQLDREARAREAARERALRRELSGARGQTRQRGPSAMDNRMRAQLVEIQDRYTNIKQQIAALRQQLKESGTFELLGPHNRVMDQRITSIATDMAKLVDPASVARESEVAAFKKMLFEPGLAIRNDTALGVLDAFERMVDERLESAYLVRGIDPAEIAGSAPIQRPPSEPAPTELGDDSQNIVEVDGQRFRVGDTVTMPDGSRYEIMPGGRVRRIQ